MEAGPPPVSNPDPPSISVLPFEFLHRYSIMSEYNLIMRFHPPGIYTLPSIDQPDVWYGLISVRKGYYAGGVFPFKLEIPEDFPSVLPPKIFLPRGFYHPYVSPQTGELDLGPEFEKWVSGTSRIFHILHYLRCIMNDLSVEAVSTNDAQKFANPEAVQVLISEPEKFGICAKTYVEENSLWSSTDCASKNGFSSPLNVLGWQNDSFISKIRDKIVNSSQPFKNCPCCSDVGSRGYSWIDPSKMTLFSPSLLCSEKME
uniref:AKT interacting protein n=1 Tax=Echinococcus granulosus TaxID=6210 RepID=A0A068WU36_ECHGR|nr:AKT interacting protein [Echinococcus granulosus]